MLIMSCYQVITFTVPFCEHSHFFVKIAIFVMVNEVKGIPVIMAQFSSCLPHACTVEISARQRGFIAWYCLINASELTATIAGPQPPDPNFHVY